MRGSGSHGGGESQSRRSESTGPPAAATAFASTESARNDSASSTSTPGTFVSRTNASAARWNGESAPPFFSISALALRTTIARAPENIGGAPRSSHKEPTRTSGSAPS